MKIVFAHDHRFTVGPDGIVYSGGRFPYELWQRYLEIADEIVVIGRERTGTTALHRLNRSSGRGVSFQLLPSISSATDLLRHRAAAVRVIRSEVRAADAVIARLPSRFGSIAASEARRSGRPVLIEVVGSAWDSYWNYGSMSGRLFAWYGEQQMRATVLRAEYALYVTTSFLQSRYPTRGRAYACSDAAVQPMPDPIPGRLASIRVARSGQGPVLAQIGALHGRTKGIHVSLRALAIVRRSGYPRAVLRLVGPGDPSPVLCEAAKYGLEKEALICDGELPGYAAVAAWLDTIDIYLQPSFQEGLPRALVEAMSRGCPCLGSTVGGIPELLPAEWLHAPGDHRLLAAHILKLCSDPELRERHALACHAAAAPFTANRLDRLRSAIFAEVKSFLEPGNQHVP